MTTAEITSIESTPAYRLEHARAALLAAQAEFDAASAAYRASRHAQDEQERAAREQSQAERERRLRAPLNGNDGFSLMR